MNHDSANHGDFVEHEVGRVMEAHFRGDDNLGREIALSLRTYAGIVPRLICLIYPEFAEGGDSSDPIPLPSPFRLTEDGRSYTGGKPRRRDSSDYVPILKGISSK